MIKNNAQLKNAQRIIDSIRQNITELSGKYAGDELDFYVGPLEIEVEELESQIEEYKKLIELPFEQAVKQLNPFLLDNISELLAKIRISAKLTQAEMAERLGWEQANLSRFENENYTSQTISKIIEFASSLGVWLHVIPTLTEELNQIALETQPLFSAISEIKTEPVFRYLTLFPTSVPNNANMVDREVAATYIPSGLIPYSFSYPTKEPEILTA
ncbi:MAG: helix-turn-helix transcriptional regulator [Anaerolineales bacterium]|jgi:transcriptional regulator with XRE-family HTH domain